jgi:hypothetical protein
MDGAHDLLAPAWPRGALALARIGPGGDRDNHVEMLEAARVGIAMPHAPAEVRAIGDRVALRQEHGGLLRSLGEVLPRYPARAAAARGRGRRATQEASMPRVKEIEDEGNDPILTELFAKERELFGAVLNTSKVYAHCPPILKAAKQLSASIERSGQLPAALLPLVYLRVALINGCPF